MDFQRDIATDLCALFACAVQRTPLRLAVDHDEGSFTYDELDIASSTVARNLIERGVQPNSSVILITAHGTRNIVAILGILKAGACYVPIDRGTWSTERIDYVLNTVESSFIINTTPEPFFSAKHESLHLETIAKPCKNTDHPIDEPSLKAESLACIIFTSGSTGKPKGVMVTHRAVANYAQTSPFNMGVSSTDRVLHILSVAFDASTGMLFSILGNSGTVVPAKMEDLYQKATSCSILASTPSILAALPFPSTESNPYRLVHTVLLGGENPPQELLKSWVGVSVKVLNAYGPTETTCASTIQEVEISEKSGTIQSNIIGKAMPQCPVYLLDENDEAIEDAAKDGEIVVTGCSLARGYYKDPTKTEDKFHCWKGSRIYRTGDIGRWAFNNDGSRVLEFRGRTDRTVKNRGFFINLETDVEAAMQSLGLGVENIYATMFRNRLVALVTPATLDINGLLEQLRVHFSSFHIPDRIWAVEMLPLSANGKVDPQQVGDLLAQAEAGETGSRDVQVGAVMTEHLAADVENCMIAALGLSWTHLDPESNFFTLGGNSLASLKLVSLCHAKGIHISTSDVYVGQTLRVIAARARSETEGPEDRLDRSERAAMAQIDLPDGCEEAGPLTSLQLELSAPTAQRPGRNTNQLRLSYELRHVDTVLSAWQRVYQVEPLFRTEIALDMDRGVQLVWRNKPFLPTKSTFCRKDEYESAVSEASLDVGLGTRLEYFIYAPPQDAADQESAAGEMTLVWTVHHTLLDGFSLATILAKVEQAIKGALIVRSPSFLSAAAGLIQLQERRHEEALAFWTRYLAGVPPTASEIPIMTAVGHQTDSTIVKKASELVFRLEDEFDAFKEAAASMHTTLATLYYTAWAMGLSVRTGALTVVVGAVFSGRETQLQYADAVGPLMATLPLVVRLRPEMSVGEQLMETMLSLSGCAEHAWSRSDQIGYRLSNLLATQYDFPSRETVIQPLRTVFFENTDFPLSLLVEDKAVFRLVWDDALYSHESMTSLAVDFQDALRSLLHARKISECIPGLSKAHKLPSMALKNSHVNSQKFDSQWTLKNALEASADLHSDLLAVEDPSGRKLSYSELDLMADAVAHAILGTCPCARTVAIHADGSLNWIVGVVGILKAGCAYCPLDPAFSKERRASVYSRSRSEALVIPYHRQLNEALPALDVDVIVVEHVQQGPACRSGRLRQRNHEPMSDALIVFTSGTTGQPKGVPISHRGLLALQSNAEATMFSHPGVRIAQFMSPAFDYCANEILSALLHGGILVLRDENDFFGHLAKVDVATITPSVLGALDPAEYTNLRIVYATGEPVTPGLVGAWAPGRLFYNAYGPAECSICTSFTRLTMDSPITIGRAISTAQMYILDPELNPVGIGIEGEIFLSGIQVMRGYIGADDQTALRIMPDPWCRGMNMYRTGDYGKWSPDGKIIYIGRIDRQVKVRGFRIELPVIEKNIYTQDLQVLLAAVTAVDDTVCAFVKPRSIDVSRLKQRMNQALQPTWVPQVIVALDEFPMTTNRKVDIKALEEMIKHRKASLEGRCKTPLQGELEESIAQEWKRLLRLEEDTSISANDDFLQLGGHSVLQMLLAARLSAAYGIGMSTKHIIRSPVLRDQAKVVKSLRSAHTGDVSADSSKTMPQRELSYPERQVWVQYQVATSTTAFNIPVLLHLEGQVDRCRLIDAINTVLSSRLILRTNFIETRDGPKRVLRDRAPVIRDVVFLNVEREINRGFDLSRDELIRVYLTSNTLLLVTSHAIADLNSVQILLGEVTRAYEGQDAGGPRFRYLCAPSWSHKTIGTEDRRFWAQFLKNIPERLPIQRRQTSAMFEGTSMTRHFERKDLESLTGLMARYGLTRHQLACTAVSQTLQWLTQTDDIVLGSPHENRSSNVERESIGLFLDKLPLRIKTPADATCTTILQSTREASQKALAHALPFHEIMNILNIRPMGYQHPVFEAMVTFHLRGVVERCLQLPHCDVRREECFSQGSKFLLMFEWTELQDESWSLRIEYDSSQLMAATVDLIREALAVVLLDGLTAEMSRCQLFDLLDRRMPPRGAAARKPCVARDELVTAIRREMASCLGIQPSGFPCSISFFEAGGDSIAAVRLQRRLKRIGLDVPITKIFELPTAQGLSDHFII